MGKYYVYQLKFTKHGPEIAAGGVGLCKNRTEAEDYIKTYKAAIIGSHWAIVKEDGRQTEVFRVDEI